MGKLGFIAKHLGLLVAGLAAYQLVLEPMLPRSIPVKGDAEHLVVLVHGLHGTPSSTNAIAQALQESDNKLLVIQSRANSGIFFSFFASSRGVVTGGRDLAIEITQVLKANPSITKLSMVGISLGGLYSRFAISELDFEVLGVEPVNFITFATPHLGVRGKLARIYEVAMQLGLAGQSGRDVFLADNPTILHSMAVDKTFLRPLSMFQRKVLVANTHFDDKVPYHTSSLVPSDSFLAEYADNQWTNSGASPDSNGNAWDSALYPNVTGVFEQRVLEWEETGNIWLENDFGANSTETAKMGRDAGTVIAGLTQDAVWEEFSPTSMEARMLRHLRSLGGWTNVHATFTDFWAPLANHNRIANVSPGGSAGQAVVDFVIKELFLGFH